MRPPASAPIALQQGLLRLLSDDQPAHFSPHSLCPPGAPDAGGQHCAHGGCLVSSQLSGRASSVSFGGFPPDPASLRGVSGLPRALSWLPPLPSHAEPHLAQAQALPSLHPKCWHEGGSLWAGCHWPLSFSRPTPRAEKKALGPGSLTPPLGPCGTQQALPGQHEAARGWSSFSLWAGLLLGSALEGGWTSVCESLLLHSCSFSPLASSLLLENNF